MLSGCSEFSDSYSMTESSSKYYHPSVAMLFHNGPDAP